MMSDGAGYSKEYDTEDLTNEMDAEIDAASGVFAATDDDLDEVEERQSFFYRIGDFFNGESRYQERVHTLTHAINIAPNAAVNYLLRGELYLAHGADELAAQDFQKALLLAETELSERDTKSLGLVAQGMQDRALVGYQEALRRQQ